MNENAKKWVEALRSGEYEQTRRYLHTDEGYCCLGVACDLFAKETGEGEWTVRPEDAPALTFEIESQKVYERSYLPRPVQEWLGLYDNAGGFTPAGDDAMSLADRNDGGASFEEIAETVESLPDRLFVS